MTSNIVLYHDKNGETTMSLLSDIKFFAKKYLKNPILVAALGYIVYRFLQKYIKKESMIESIKILDDTHDDYFIIFDDKTNKFILIYGLDIFSSDTEEELRDKVKELKGE